MSEKTRSELRVWLPTALWMIGLVIGVVCLGFLTSMVVSLFVAAVIITIIGAWLDYSDFE